MYYDCAIRSTNGQLQIKLKYLLVLETGNAIRKNARIINVFAMTQKNCVSKQSKQIFSKMALPNVNDEKQTN